MEKAITQVNTLVKKKLSTGFSACKMSQTSPAHNTVTAYAARFGMENLPTFSVFDSSMGNISELLSLDMGWGPLDPIYEPLLNLGQGEIFSGTKALSPNHASSAKVSANNLTRMNRYQNPS